MMKDLFSLEGRVALVTGGSRGIGKMITQGFLEQGAKVYITARKAPACDQTAEELSQYGSCVSLPHDIERQQVREHRQGIVQRPAFVVAALECGGFDHVDFLPDRVPSEVFRERGRGRDARVAGQPSAFPAVDEVPLSPPWVSLRFAPLPVSIRICTGDVSRAGDP